MGDQNKKISREEFFSRYSYSARINNNPSNIPEINGAISPKNSLQTQIEKVIPTENTELNKIIEQQSYSSEQLQPEKKKNYFNSAKKDSNHIATLKNENNSKINQTKDFQKRSGTSIDNFKRSAKPLIKKPTTPNKPNNIEHTIKSDNRNHSEEKLKKNSEKIKNISERPLVGDWRENNISAKLNDKHTKVDKVIAKNLEAQRDILRESHGKKGGKIINVILPVLLLATAIGGGTFYKISHSVKKVNGTVEKDTSFKLDTSTIENARPEEVYAIKLVNSIINSNLNDLGSVYDANIDPNAASPENKNLFISQLDNFKVIPNSNYKVIENKSVEKTVNGEEVKMYSIVLESTNSNLPYPAFVRQDVYTKKSDLSKFYFYSVNYKYENGGTPLRSDI